MNKRLDAATDQLLAMTLDQLLALTIGLHAQLKAKVAAGTASQQEIAAVNTARKAIAIHQNHAGRKNQHG